MSETLIQLRQNSRKNSIFDLIREQNKQLSRYDICKITKYSTTTIKGIVDSLIDEGLISEMESKDTRVGRRPAILSVNEDAIYFAGIECSSAAVNFTVINAAQKIVHHCTLSLSNPMTADVLTAMEEILDNYRHQYPQIWERIPNLVITLPGKIDCEKGIGIRYGNITDWKQVEFRSILSKFGKEMFFTSNVDSMLNGYRKENHISPEKSIMFIIIRNSVGVRLYSNGTLLSKFGVLSEVAHMKASGSSRRCSCGKKGCYDTEISARAIQNKLQEACNAHLFRPQVFHTGLISDDLKTFLALVSSGEPVAYDIFLEVMDYIVELLETLFAFFHPDLVIISSFLCENSRLFAEQLQKRLEKQEIGDLPSFDYILPANELASFGAAITGYENYFCVNSVEI
ncbi:MAG: ROK family protein [Fusicatenibacter sp.]